MTSGSPPWKGDCQHHDGAWSHPEPYPASFDVVGRDYSGYVAFDKRQATIR